MYFTFDFKSKSAQLTKKYIKSLKCSMKIIWTFQYMSVI